MLLHVNVSSHALLYEITVLSSKQSKKGMIPSLKKVIVYQKIRLSHLPSDVNYNRVLSDSVKPHGKDRDLNNNNKVLP